MSTPEIGDLLLDTGHEDRIGEFRGMSGPYWALRPLLGGREWEAEPARVRPLTPRERLRAATAERNARSRGERL
ncbi:hypothetical protein [uncultured Streptomyces sp.]|uniref:hypothetical protein n=1 Tax=uncultured Streptomyces sp. TaxID=174707 RepID=UPI00262C721F|nr:hypothetical protein [uncultured Streptomyces sp.]